MRITINQAVVDKHYEQLGLIRLSAPPPAREAPSLAHLAALVSRHSVGFAEISRIEDDAFIKASALAAPAPIAL